MKLLCDLLAAPTHLQLKTWSLDKAKTHITATAKRIGLLLLLLNAQLNVGQEAAEAKNALRSQSASLFVSTKSSSSGKPESSNSLCPAGLAAAVEAVTNRPQFSRGRWGILIQSLSASPPLYSRDAQKYFVPASNMKLLTTAAALHQLGSKFRIRTSVYGIGDGLRVVGRGDPSLSDAQLKELAQQLSRRGIRQVSQVIAEDDYFRGSGVNPSWEWEDVQADYGAPVNSLILNQNAVNLTLLPQTVGQPVRVSWADPTEATRWRIENDSVTTSTEPPFINVSRDLQGAVLKVTGQLSVNSEPEPVALAVLDPGEQFLRHFRRALAAEGIKETADIRSSTQISKLINVELRGAAVTELAAVESPPLSELLVETNQNSNNLYAEALLRSLGAKASKITVSNSTDEVGLRVVKATLTELGVDPAGYVMADGSGLSRHNLVSPEAIAQTLRAMAKSPEAAVYRASLPVAGISGTLQNRFRDSPAQGIVQAKTGTMSGIVALSGYLDPPKYEPLVFSIIVNQSDQPAATIRQAIDEIVLLITRLHRCSLIAISDSPFP